MKNKFLIIILLLGVMVSAAGAKPVVRINTGNPYDFSPPPPSPNVTKAQVQISANNISTWVQNTGTFNQDIRTNNTPGFSWGPKTSYPALGTVGKFAIFTTGLSIGTYLNGSLRLGNASYNGEYAPGYVDQTNPADPRFKTNSSFKLYKVKASDNAITNPDWANWGLMVPYGAPFVDKDGNGIYDPLVDKPGIKDAAETVFLCMTDADPSTHSGSEGFSGGTLPIFAEVHLTVWAYTSPGLEDLQFVNWSVINKSGVTWDSTHFSVVVDPDLGDANDDYIGCDLSKNMGFVYNADNDDPSYGAAPPSSGMDFFKSPIVFTGNPADADTSYFPPGSENRIIRPGYKQMGLTSFVYFTNGGNGGLTCERDPDTNPITGYYYMQGLKKDGTPWLDPTNNNAVTKYCYPGDPETNAGWTEFDGLVKNCGGVLTGQTEASPPGDRRFIFNSGAKSFQVASGDTQNVVLAQFIAKGSNNLNSVTRLKNNDAIAQRVFDLNFKVIPPPPPPVVSVSTKPNSNIGTVDITLSWGDISEQYNYKDILFGQGTYKFQGYEIYEIKKSATSLPNFNEPETINNDVTLIDIYDLRDNIGIVIDTFRTGVAINDTAQFAPFPIVPPYKMNVPNGFPNKGISRSITLRKTTYTNENGGRDNFISGNEYRFAVVAYGVIVDSIGPGGSRVLKGSKVIRNSLATQMITIRPEAPVAGTVYPYSNGDTITTNRKDLGVTPVIVDQSKLIDATYRISFRNDTTYNILRRLASTPPADQTYDTLKKVIGSDSKFLRGKNNADTSILNLKFTRNRIGGTDSSRVVDGMLMNVYKIRTVENGIASNQGVLRDVTPTTLPDSIQNRSRGWDYLPAGNNWLEGSKYLYNPGNKWQSPSMSLSYPTSTTYTGLGSLYKADSLMRVKIVFAADTNSGQIAYRYVDNAVANTLGDTSFAPFIPVNRRAQGFIYIERRRVPFKVYKVDIQTGVETQVNCAFVERNAPLPDGRVDGMWMPTSDSTSGSERLVIFGSTYQDADIAPYPTYTTGPLNLLTRQAQTDIMYIWAPKAINASARWSAGDQFFIYPYTVTRPGVVYEFSTQKPNVGSVTVASETNALNDIRVVPNPYYGFNVNEKSSTQRFVTFRKLPINCTIRIYTLNGDLVKKIVKNDMNSTVNWELKNLEDVPVASGLYIVLIEAPGIGQKTMKLAIFTPEERVEF